MKATEILPRTNSVCAFEKKWPKSDSSVTFNNARHKIMPELLYLGPKYQNPPPFKKLSFCMIHLIITENFNMCIVQGVDVEHLCSSKEDNKRV